MGAFRNSRSTAGEFLMRVLCVWLLLLIGCAEDRPSTESIMPVEFSEPMDSIEIEPTFKVDVDLAPFQEMIDSLAARQEKGAYTHEIELAAEQAKMDYDQLTLLMKHNVNFKSDSLRFKADLLRGRLSDQGEWESFFLEDQAWLQYEDMGSATADKIEINLKNEIIRFESQAIMQSQWGSLSGKRIEVYIDGSQQVHSQQGHIQLMRGDNEMIDIQADALIWQAGNQHLVCKEQVVVEQLDMQMSADWLEVRLKDSHEIDWLKAGEPVTLEAESMSGMADRIEYDSQDEVFTLTGSANVYQAGNKLMADRVYYWPKADRLRCEPQAKVWFSPAEKEE